MDIDTEYLHRYIAVSYGLLFSCQVRELLPETNSLFGGDETRI